MKLKVLQENLAKALSVSSRFASSRAQLPVLGNVLLKTKNNKLLVSATNLEISVSISVGAKIDRQGEITVPARTIHDLVSNLSPGSISLTAEKEQLNISSTNFSSTLAGMNSADFPPVPHKVGKAVLNLDIEDFTNACSQVLFSASTDETRPVLTGILLIFQPGKLHLVATDGFRLSQKVLKLPGVKKSPKKQSIILPKNALSELLRLTDGGEPIAFSFKEGDSQAVFSASSSVLASRVIEGEFPDFEKIIPKDTVYKVALDREELLRAVKLASVFARDAANVIKLTLLSGSIEVLAESSQSGNQKATIDAKVTGAGSKSGKELLKIAFNYRFLEDFLNVVKGDEVRLELSSANSPGVFLDPTDSDFLHLIMPVKTQD